MELWQFFRDNSDVSKPWQRAQRIASNVAGAGCIIQSDFASSAHGNFEVVVPVAEASGSIDLSTLAPVFNSGNPRGILTHSAVEPWGPWSPEPVMIFDATAGPGTGPCDGAGYGKFMHVSYAVAHCDHVQDDMLCPGTFREDDWGGEYGPYQITRYTRGGANETVEIWFTMSTWNLGTHTSPC